MLHYHYNWPILKVVPSSNNIVAFLDIVSFAAITSTLQKCVPFSVHLTASWTHLLLHDSCWWHWTSWHCQLPQVEPDNVTGVTVQQLSDHSHLSCQVSPKSPPVMIFSLSCSQRSPALLVFKQCQGLPIKVCLPPPPIIVMRKCLWRTFFNI